MNKKFLNDFNSFTTINFFRMLSKKVNWSVLAQCDFFAVERFVQSSGREAMRTVNPLRASIFDRKLFKKPIWNETYQAICKAYSASISLHPEFSIVPHKFGRYRLLYTGEKFIRPSTILRRVPVGFIRAVPDGVVTDLSVMSSERNGEQLLLLGPLRFVNSDCNPNCSYDFSSQMRIVELKVERRLLPGDEISLKYGPDFFEYDECKSRPCWLQKIGENYEYVFEYLLDDLLLDLSQEVVQQLNQESIVSNTATIVSNTASFELTSSQCGATRSKKRRICGRELVGELWFPAQGADGFSENLPGHRVPSSAFHPSTPLNDSVSVSSVINSDDCLTSPSTSTSKHGSTNLDETLDPILLRVSSPLLLCSNQPPAPPVSSIAESVKTYVHIKGNENFSPKLFEGSDVNLTDATALAEIFCSRFHLSDECSVSLFP